VKTEAGGVLMEMRRYVAGKKFRTMKEAVAYRRAIVAVTIGGWLLSMIFAGMWIYERWIL